MYSEKEPFPFVGGSMNLPYMPGVRRVSLAGLPCDPGRVESGVRKRFRFIALLTLAVFMAGLRRPPRRSPTIWTIPSGRPFPLVPVHPNRPEYPSGSATGHPDMEQQAAVTLPEDPCFFLKRTWATIS